MELVKMYETAIREKYRFAMTKGSMTMEDLWDLPLDSKKGQLSLNDVAKKLYKQIKLEDEVDFVNPQPSKTTDQKCKLEIVRHIISVRLKENDDKKNAAVKKARNEKIKGILAEKEFDGKSADELRAMLNED